MDLRNKKVTVVGMGSSGIDSVLLLERAGAIVSITDSGDDESVKERAECLAEKYINLETGRHTESFLEDTELLVVSPGVENGALPIRYANENNIPIISELELGYLFCEGTIVAITGTNGKTTVATLLGEILRSAGIPVNVCGNIGNSLSGETGNIKKDTVVILETSSFQLERIDSFKPKISVILNVTEDHLDRYRNFEEYLDAKKRIFKNQETGDIIVLNYDDKNLRDLIKTGKVRSKALYFSMKKKVDGIYLDRGNIKLSLKNKTKNLMVPGDYKLKGAHNTENVMVSCLVATLLGASPDAVKKAVKNFKPLAHRFESVALVGGVEFIDDSKATNIDSTSRALLSLDKPAILIAGGKDKNLSYEKVLPAIKKNVKKIILIGETKPKMRKIFKDFVDVREADTLPEAVILAYKSASPGESVLLSPMCSSFDMFGDYKERGEVFRRAVGELRVKDAVD
ncbi:MAG: UDP-N-acetylmuramoyl-L-alanine--D-glutamate ligase [Candidatus Omnitrophica bacterium]|nr:UDP-N-acetylmuramoyl-L-alanine--D-glutamate ligase [Candidatus Omnitrophota bacterium]